MQDDVEGKASRRALVDLVRRLHTALIAAQWPHDRITQNNAVIDLAEIVLAAEADRKHILIEVFAQVGKSG